LKFNKDNVIDVSSEEGESTIGDKLMVPDMNDSP
jgi:hypothetical protein